MSSTDVIKIDYSLSSDHDDIVHAKIIKNLDIAIDQMKKNEIKLKINDKKYALCQTHSDRFVPTLKLRKLDDSRYRAEPENNSKIISNELEKHQIRSIKF
jgi:hypothetical protein